MKTSAVLLMLMMACSLQRACGAMPVQNGSLESFCPSQIPAVVCRHGGELYVDYLNPSRACSILQALDPQWDEDPLDDSSNGNPEVSLATSVQSERPHEWRLPIPDLQRAGSCLLSKTKPPP